MARKKRLTYSGPSLFPEEELLNARYHGASQKVAAERLPTNTTTHQYPIHRWFNFIAGFSPAFVDACCEPTAGQQQPLTFLDPFVGCATGPLVALHRGMRAIGYEPHPFFLRIARAKLPG